MVADAAGTGDGGGRGGAAVRGWCCDGVCRFAADYDCHDDDRHAVDDHGDYNCDWDERDFVDEHRRRIDDGHDGDESGEHVLSDHDCG
jgi:hypothetical protein